MSIDPCKGGAEKKEPKHFRIISAVRKLKYANQRLDGLLLEITGEERVEEAKNPVGESMPTLAVFLNSCAEIITKQTEEIIDLTESIRNEIF